MKVSVIIPCFNHGEYIDEAVDSILNQTYQDFEIIIIDDGSTDSLTIEKLKSYNKQKTKVIRTKNNGLPAARNKGIQLGTGKYILTLDADDKFHPSFLEMAVPILNKNKKIGVVTCFCQTFGLYKQIWHTKGGDIKDFLVNNNCLSGALFRKTCWNTVGGYDEKMKEGYEDWNFWIGITEKGWNVHVIKYPLFFYRISKSSMYSNTMEKHPELVKQVVINNKNLYQKYLDYVIYEKEKTLYEKEKTLQEILNSESYKIASYIISKIRFIKHLLPINHENLNNHSL